MSRIKLSQPILHEPYDDSLELYLAARSRSVGNKLFDLSKHKNHGVITSAVFKPDNYGLNKLQFDGANDAVRVSDNFNFGSKISCLSWIKGAAQNGKRFIGQHDYGVGQRSFSTGLSDISPYDKLVVSLSDDGSWDALHRKHYHSSIVIGDDKWHLVGFTFEDGVLKIFIDGVEDTNPTKTFDDAITAIHNSTADVVIGAGITSNVLADLFAGKLANLRLYNRVLSPSENSQLHEKTKHIYT